MYGGYDDPMFNIMTQNSNRVFTEMYKCYSVTMMSGNERENVNYGGKIILPQSSLAKLSGLAIVYPMLFELHNQAKQRHSHAGVLEFTAEEGRVYLPYWMMQTLLLEEGDFIEVKNTTLPLGTFVKIQPQSVQFLDINDPKAVLENALRNFSALTQGDIIQINYNKKIYEILVLEAKPSNNVNNGISIVETDLEVDFAPPLGYVEPKPQLKPSMANKIKIEDIPADTKGFSAFQGSGQRLNGKNGKAVKASSYKASSSKSNSVTEKLKETNENGISDDAPAPLNLPFGKLFFGYKVVPVEVKEQVENGSTSFKGEGQRLRPSKRK